MGPFRLACLTLALLTLGACDAPPPIRLGFIGGISGANADLGSSGRNGVQLAIEQANAQGGVRGRSIELLIKDDQLDPEQGQRATQQLIDAQVAAILGPMTSTMAVASAPLATRAGVLMMAGTVTTQALAGVDDQFFRTIGSTAQHAAIMANYLYDKRAIRLVNLAVDLRNQAYSQSWQDDFSRHFQSLGGRIGHVQHYTSSAQTDFVSLANSARSGQPHALVLITSALDAALLCNQLRQQQPDLLLATSEWAGTGELIELGGRAVEGVVVPNYLDQHSQTPAFMAFRTAYRQRFQHDPGYPALVAYNATQVVLQALSAQQPGESLKQTLLRQRDYPGLLGPIHFDDFGDTRSHTYLTLIRNGEFINAH